MLPQCIFQQNDLSIYVSSSADPQGVALLQRTVYGTEGIRYRHLSHQARISKLTDPLFFNLYAQDTLVGTYCLSGRQILMHGKPIYSHYGRYLSIDPAVQGRGYGTLLKRQALVYLKTHQASEVQYSYIENSNVRSKRISADWTVRATLEGFMYSCLFPRKSAQVEAIQAQDQEIMQAKLEALYASYDYVNEPHTNLLENYFVYKEKGIIRAGLRAEPIAWELVSFPGFAGKAMRALSYVPVLNRLFSRSRLSFLTIDQMYMEPGGEKQFLQLLDGVLAYYGMHRALFMRDAQDPLNKALKHYGKLGILYALSKDTTSSLVMQSATPLSFTERPVLVSLLDCT